MHSSWSRFCTVNHRASASNYQLSNTKNPGQDSNWQRQRLKVSTLTATPPSPPPPPPPPPPNRYWKEVNTSCLRVCKENYNYHSSTDKQLPTLQLQFWLLISNPGADRWETSVPSTTLTVHLSFVFPVFKLNNNNDEHEGMKCGVTNTCARITSTWGLCFWMCSFVCSQLLHK